MKNLMIRLLPALFLAAPVLAAGKSDVYQAVIRAELTAKSSTAYTGGSVHVDGRTGVVELTLQPVMPACAEDMVCAQMMPEPITYTLENATSDIDSCGIIHTRAVFDRRPVDGIYLSVLINNNSNISCPTLVAVAPLEVIVDKKYYDRVQGKEVSQRDTFDAQDIALINPANKGDVLFSGQILGARYQDKKLELNLSYAGGCEEHAFDLKWGECKDVKVLNSVISQCEVSIIVTEGANDHCRAFVTKKHTIDLSGLAQAYVINLNGTRVLVH